MLEQSSTHMYTCSQLSSHNIQLLYHHIDIYNRYHHCHSASCNEHTNILCARAARKQTTTSGAATTYYHHHTVQVTTHAFSICSIPLQKNNTSTAVQVTRHAFGIGDGALEKCPAPPPPPPPPPPHSASHKTHQYIMC